MNAEQGGNVMKSACCNSSLCNTGNTFGSKSGILSVGFVRSSLYEFAHALGKAKVTNQLKTDNVMKSYTVIVSNSV